MYPGPWSTHKYSNWEAISFETPKLLVLSMNNFFSCHGYILCWLVPIFLAKRLSVCSRSTTPVWLYSLCLNTTDISFFVFNAKVYLVRVLVLVFILDYESYPEKNNFRAQIYRSEIFLVNIKAKKSSRHWSVKIYWFLRRGVRVSRCYYVYVVAYQSWKFSDNFISRFLWRTTQTLTKCDTEETSDRYGHARLSSSVALWIINSWNC